MRRHKESVTLSTSTDHEFNHIFPNGYFLDTTTDEIWVGSGIVCAIDIESASTNANWNIQIHDFHNGTFQTLPKTVVVASSEFSALTPYGALGIDDTIDLAELTTSTKRWSANAFKASATTVATYTETFHFEPMIACPHGMCILIQPIGAGNTPAIALVSVTFESWVKGFTRYRNRNKPASVFA